MRRLAALPLALLIATPVCTPALSAEAESWPHLVAETFCMARTIGDMSMITEHLSSELYLAVGQAVVRNDEIQKQHPDEKPPLGDGIPWSSYMDAVPSCEVDYEAAKTTPAEIPVTYSFPDAPDAGWTDTLVLVQVEGEWLLDDIVYQDGSRLTDVLVAAFET